VSFGNGNLRSPEQRVVVTGMGINTVIGDSLATYCRSLMAGQSGITRWKNMDQRIVSAIGGDLSDFDVDEHVARVGSTYPQDLIQSARKLLRATPLSGRLTAMAALQAFVESGLHEAPNLDHARVAHVLAGHNLCSDYIVENTKTHTDEPEFIDPLFGLMSLDTDVLSVTSELLNLRGPSFTVGGACASGNLAILAALDLLRSGRADVALVSGGAVDLDPVILQGWTILEALTFKSFNDRPDKASRPFDRLREGFVPSEGAGVLVLETMSHAQRRGAPIQAEILGASSMSDACRLTKPNEDGQVRAMRAALSDARVNPEQVDYVNAHATSTPLGDAVEVAALKTALGSRAHEIPVNSTKSLLGHCLTAAGVVEMVATVVQLREGFVHATINQEEKDPELDLDFVPNQSREYKGKIAISNSFGFGGLNSCVVVASAA